jgi:hypothetical protein
MDNLTQDNQIGVAAETVSGAAKAVKGIVMGIVEKGELKKAKKKIAAGQANTLSGRAIDICLEAGIDPKTFDTNPTYNARPAVIAAKAAAIKMSGAVGTDAEAIDAAKKDAVNSALGVGMKQYLPYIAGAAVLIFLIFIIRKK